MITAATNIKTMLKKLWRWFSLADVPTVSSGLQCDLCEGKATTFISVNINGNAHNNQWCQRHKPETFGFGPGANFRV